MDNVYKTIKMQIISEKGTDLAQKNNQYLFRVAPEANKIDVKRAVEKIYNVTVTNVQIVNRPGKVKRRGLVFGRTPATKRAVVRLKEGDSINLV